MKIISILLTLLIMVTGWNAPVWADSIDQTLIDETTQLWETSVHALNDVNCSSCHQNKETKEFVSKPDHESCRSCHEQAVDTFLLGKHGIRLNEGMEPLTPAMARLPMQEQAHNLQMNCNTCHNVHSVNTLQASVDSCLTCHSDQHSLNYKNSPHGKLFTADANLPRPSGNAVTCATCHLPRHQKGVGANAVTLVNHNNTYTLLPRDRMVKDVCTNCHGVEYGYNSIFDDELVDANFDKPPTLEMETFDLIRAFEEKRNIQS